MQSFIAIKSVASPAPNTLNPISQCIYQTILSLFINPFFTLDWELPEEKKQLLFNSIFWESRIANRIKSKEQVPKNMCWMTFTTSIDTLRSEANNFGCCQSPRIEKWNTFLSTGKNLINSWNPLFPWKPWLFCLTVPMI